ncbi:MAG: L-iditol 2-dehydrogenase [Thermoproteota archaeon]|nr:L-iditol 2-dehydrogenase [Thermoproteota archaeon]
MKAVVKKDGMVGVEVVDVPYPKLRPGWVIMKVKAAGICGSDLHSYQRTTVPRAGPMGHECAGEVVEVGEGVQNVKTGDHVTYNPFALRTNQSCGECYFCLTGQPLGCAKRPPTTSDGGCMAEYMAVDSRSLFKLPENVPYEIGALIEPFGVSYHGVLESSSLKPSQTLVILGPGTIGIAALIAAKLVTPEQIIMTGTNADEAVRFKLAKTLGATELINVQKEDPVKKVRELTDDVGADVVLEAVGGHHPQLITALKMLAYGAECIVIGHPERVEEPVASIDGVTYNHVITRRQKIIGSWIYDTLTYMRIIKLLQRKLVDLKPLLTHELPLSEAEKGFELGFKQECIKVMLKP